MLTSHQTFYNILLGRLSGRMGMPASAAIQAFRQEYHQAVSVMAQRIGDVDDSRQIQDIDAARTAYLAALDRLKASGQDADIVSNTWTRLLNSLTVRHNRLSPIDTIKHLLDSIAADYTAAANWARSAPTAENNTNAAALFDERTLTDTDYTELSKAWLTLTEYEIEYERLAGEYRTGDPVGSELIQDGYYGSEANRVSPEGIVYGATTRIQTVSKQYWWDGTSWVLYEVAGRANAMDSLPLDLTRPFGQVWEVRRYVRETNEYVWDPYFWDSSRQAWRRIRWYWPVDKSSDLPRPAFAVGEGHTVEYTDVPMYWNNYGWSPEKHSNLWDDEPEKHASYLLIGTLALRETASARVVYYSNREIGLESIAGTPGQVWVNGEFISASRTCSVYNNLAVLNVATGGELVQERISLVADYHVYLAGNEDGFQLPGLPADGDLPACPAWDYRAKLFLSRSADVNGYLYGTGSGARARLVGRISTDNTPHVEGGPYFLRELDISLISSEVSLPETYRSYSDFTLRYQDNARLRLDRLPGRAGNIYVSGQLYKLGQGYTVHDTDPWVNYVEAGPGIANSMELRTQALSPDSIYYVYLAAPVDEFNFNAINPGTGRPWMPEDTGSSSNYFPSKDLRLRVFLSDKSQEDHMMAGSWPGYMARFLGTVVTDAYGGFRPSANISAIQIEVPQSVLASTTAEIRVDLRNTFEIRLEAQAGTSGLVLVGDETMVIQPAADTTPFMIGNNSYVYQYVETSVSDYLSPMDKVEDWPDGSIYLYLGNNQAALGECAGGLFFTDTQPSHGHLSANWPGNNARFVAEVLIENGGFQRLGSLVSGLAHSGIVDNEPEKHRLIDDDGEPSRITLYSSEKISSEHNKLWAALSNHLLFEQQKTEGLPVRLDWVSTNKIRFTPVPAGSAIAFPDDTAYDLDEPFDLTVTGVSGTVYYVYMKVENLVTFSPYISTIAPDTRYDKMHTSGTRSVLAGWLAFSTNDNMQGNWCVCSFAHEPTRMWEAPITGSTTTLNLPGLIIGEGRHGTLARTGQSCVATTCCVTVGSKECWI